MRQLVHDLDGRLLLTSAQVSSPTAVEGCPSAVALRQAGYPVRVEGGGAVVAAVETGGQLRSLPGPHG